jgi:hypothetical protein
MVDRPGRAFDARLSKLDHFIPMAHDLADRQIGLGEAAF